MKKQQKTKQTKATTTKTKTKKKTKNTKKAAHIFIELFYCWLCCMKLYFFFPSTEVIRFLIIAPPLREISRFSARYPHKTRSALPACHCDLPSITMCIAALAFDYSSVTRLHFGQLTETDQLFQFCCCDTACVPTNNVWSNFLNMLR